MRKRFFARLLFVALLLSLAPSQMFARATDTAYGTITIENRNETDTTFSCDVKLSGATIQGGYVFAVLCAESEQVKQVAEYPAAETVKVKLQNVAATDFVKILWTDGNHMPLASPAELPMSKNNAAAYDNFAQAVAKEKAKLAAPDVAPLNDDDVPLARLLVSADPLPDISKYKDNLTTEISGPDNFYVLQFDNIDVANACKVYLNDPQECPSVRYAESDTLMYEKTKKPAQESPVLQSVPSHLSWGVEKTGIGDYAEYIKTSKEKSNLPTVIVAVVDSGVDTEGHSLFNGRMVKGYDFVEWDENPKDEHDHGTHVASTVVDCTPGLENVKIMPVRVLNKFGGGSRLDIILGIDYAISHGANIINLSLNVSRDHMAIDDAVNRALSKGITVVTAAGNYSGDAKKCCPAHIKDCITVAAVSEPEENEPMKRYERSNFGDVVDIAAPGDNVKGLVTGGETKSMSGTSMAAPHVSAAAALLICDFGKGLTPTQISNRLKSNASEIPFDEKDKDWKDWKNSDKTNFLGAGFLNMRPFIQSGFYAILYADGEMVFQKSDTPASGRTVLGTYPLTSSGEGNSQYAGWYAHRADIRKVTFAESVKPVSTALWFCKCNNLTEVQGLKNLDTSEVTDMSQMFASCTSLKTLDLRGLDTRKVKNMNSMFFFCTNLTELDLTAWDTKNVTDTRDMFKGCGALKTLHASDSFSTAKVSDSAGMFQDCKALLGGQNTVYDPAHTDKAYAHMDGGSSNPGYFKDRDKERPNKESPVPTTVTVGNAKATIGTDKTVSIPVSVQNLDKVAGVIIQVTYPEGLSVKEGAVAYNSVFESQNDNAKDGKNPLQISWNAGSAKEVTYSGELCTINFDVLDTAKAGDYDITVKVTDAALNGGADITDNVQTVNGTLTLYGNPNPEPKDVAITYMASPTEGGTISGATTAKEGAEVTVTATPNENYKLVKITVNGTEINVNKFTVPTGVTSLTVTATFEKLPDGEPTLTLGNAEATIGTDATISVPVSVRNLNKAAGLIIKVTYPRGLSVKEGAVAYNSVFESQNDNAKDGKNPLQIAWNAGSAKEVTYSGELCTIHFDVLNTAKDGTYDITVEVADAALNGGADITDDIITVKGQVTLKYGDNSSPAVTVGNAEAMLGTDKTVSVPVSVRNFNKAAGLIIKVKYPAGLSVKEGAVVYQSVFESQLDNAKNGKNPLQIAWNAGSAKEVSYSGELCTINFDVLDTAKAGTYDIIVEVADAALNGGKDVTNAFVVDNGQITIKKHFDVVPTLVIGDAQGTPGKTVTVPVSVQNLNKVAGLIIRVAYPKSFSVKEGAVVYQNVFESKLDNAKNGKNPVQISWNAGSTKEVTYDGELCSITFTVPDSAKSGTYDITPQVVDASLNGGDDITNAFAVIPGKLTIVS